MPTPDPVDDFLLPGAVRRVLAGGPRTDARVQALRSVAAAIAAFRGPGETAWKRPLAVLADRAMQALASGFASDVSEAHALLDEELGRAAAEAFAAALPGARAELARAESIIAAAALDPLAGACVELRAVAQAIPESALVASFLQFRATYAGIAREAAAMIEAGPGGGLEAAERLRASISHLERARAFGRSLTNPAATLALEPEFRDYAAPGNPIERLNRHYYASRGAAIYDDFRTLARDDPTLSRADAIHFCARMRALESRGALPPGPIDVAEVGIGDGSFAAHFLAHVETMDVARDAGLEPLLPRIRYHLCDFSRRMIEDAAQRPALARFKAQIAFHEFDANSGAPLPVRPVHLRLQELLDDVPGVAVVHRDAAGRDRRALARAVVRLDRALARRDGSSITPEALARAWVAEDRAVLDDLSPGTLAAIEWEAQLAPPGDSGAEVAASASAPDLLFPVSEGASRILARFAADLLPGIGEARAFDYAGHYGADRRTYLSASSIIRRYGGSATANLNIDGMKAALGARGIALDARTTVNFVSASRGQATLRVSGLSPDSGVVSYARFASADRCVFPLRMLVHHEQIVARAAAAMPHDRERFRAFADDVRAAGWVHPGLPLGFLASAGGPLENLAFELDSALGATFRAPAARFLTKGIEWFEDPRALEDPLREVMAMGYSKEALTGLADRRDIEPLWVLTIASKRK